MVGGCSPEGPAGAGAQRQKRASERKPTARQRAPPATGSRSWSVFSNRLVLTRPRLLPPPGNRAPPPPRCAHVTSARSRAQAGRLGGGSGRPRPQEESALTGSPWRSWWGRRGVQDLRTNVRIKLSPGSCPDLVRPASGYRPDYSCLTSCLFSLR